MRRTSRPERAEPVLDLGSGGGVDVLLSARRVGPEGKAYGLGITEEMLELARRNQADAGIANAEFLLGHIEAVPLPDASVDVVISNCVLSLLPAKEAVLAEAHRVLRPGGAWLSPTWWPTRRPVQRRRQTLPPGSRVWRAA